MSQGKKTHQSKKASEAKKVTRNKKTSELLENDNHAENKKNIQNKKNPESKKNIQTKAHIKDKEYTEPETAEKIETTGKNLSNPTLFFNRELSWLEFNDRVLEEAQDKNNPILERLKFLAITASNLDEFFMVRVSGLMDQVEAEFSGRDPSGMTPTEQLEAISDRVHSMVHKQYNCLNRSILPAMERENIFIREYDQLSKAQMDYIAHYFETTLYPILTPMAIDQSRPFPLLNNRSINIIVELDQRSEELYAVVQVPTVVSRILTLPAESDAKEIILTEDIIKQFCYKLFNGHTPLNTYAFRITRNSDLTIDEEEAEDLLYEMEKSIKRRKWGEPVRLEIEKNMSKNLRSFLKTSLELDERDIYEILGPLDLTMFMKLSGLKGYDHLRNTPLEPVPSVSFYNKDIFKTIRDRDILLHHPYESFDAVVNYIKIAAIDPDVLAIKQTLYRVSGNSPIVNALIQAAENGKQVTVLVELKARFDEENNIIWAKKLEKAGCHVVYGLVGLKTHCKICLVVRRDDDGIRRYIHLGTGNYNDSTAKIYTDMGYFTCKEAFGQDISALFNVLTGYSINLSWNKIAVAPISLRELFMKYINNEIRNAELGKDAFITAKMNSLVDTTIIQALYRASIAGVKISLVVRGICCLRSGIEGISDNIQVMSIVDRFLEHSRIYCFCNGGDTKIFLSSADWMPRNLDKRVEVAFPIDNEDAKSEIMKIMDITLSDTVKLRVQQPDGTYSKVDRRGKESIQSQLLFHKMAQALYQGAVAMPVEEKFRPNAPPRHTEPLHIKTKEADNEHQSG